ncbi:MAG: LysR family transcriptional regulator [Phycisphaerales bacterium]|nr:LysR family transcriptional regulator [Phycisphaerales bacterium]MCB9855417.1 LysR family transcriptional regulator [Phycisphaerales bacterium]
MELHQLRYFVAVADLQNFTRAAEKCLVSQPSLSQQIIKLEREISQPLFDRLGRTVRLTEAGRAMYDRAMTILRSVDELQDRVNEATEPTRGAIRIGAIPTIAPYFLPPILKRFSRRFPDATIEMHEDLTPITERRCAEGELDVGIIATAPSIDALHAEPLFDEELLLALPPSHRLTMRRRLALSDVADEPFVLMSELHCLGEQVVGFCRQQGCSPVIRCQSVQLLMIQKLVALGLGVSLIPSMAVEKQRDRRCVYRSLTPPTPTRTIRMIWHKDRYQSPLAREMIQSLRTAES